MGNGFIVNFAKSHCEKGSYFTMDILFEFLDSQVGNC